jgi:hypothetical protein
MIIYWSDKFLTGHGLVDHQHQSLFQAINEFEIVQGVDRALGAGRRRSEVVAGLPQTHCAQVEDAEAEANAIILMEWTH